MFYRIFSSRSPFLIILIPIMGVLLWFKAFMASPSVTLHFDAYQMPLYRLLDHLLEFQPVWNQILMLLLVIIQGFILNVLNRKYMIIYERTYLPAFFYVLIASSFVEFQRLNPALIGSLFLIIAIDQLFGSYKKRGSVDNFFRAAFFLSLGSLFYFPLVFFIFFVWIAASRLRAFNLREWFHPLIGAVIPYIIVLGYYYVFRDELFYALDYLKATITHQAGVLSHFTLPYIVFYSFLLLLVIISILSVFSNLYKKKIQARKYITLFFWLLMIAVAVFFLDPSAGFEMIIIAASPLSLLLSGYFVDLRAKGWGEFTFFIVFVLLVLIQLVKYQVITM